MTVGQPLITRMALPRYKFTGTLSPIHYSGTTPLTLVISKRRDNGEWVINQKVRAVVQLDATGTYKAMTSLVLPGRYRVRAEHLYPTSYSPYRYFTLR